MSTNIVETLNLGTLRTRDGAAEAKLTDDGLGIDVRYRDTYAGHVYNYAL